MLLNFILSRKSKIADFDDTLTIDENVGWLQITMNYIFVVYMLDPMQQL